MTQYTSLAIKEKIKKLPKWAQAYIRDIQRQRETAVRALNEYLDGQTESPFFYDDLHCLKNGGPDRGRRYVQTSHITARHAGIDLEIHLHKRDHIFLSWSTTKFRRDVAFIPTTYQQARLVVKENMG